MIILATTKDCERCEEAKRKLEEAGAAYIEIDVTSANALPAIFSEILSHVLVKGLDDDVAFPISFGWGTTDALETEGGCSGESCSL